MREETERYESFGWDARQTVNRLRSVFAYANVTLNPLTAFNRHPRRWDHELTQMFWDVVLEVEQEHGCEICRNCWVPVESDLCVNCNNCRECCNCMRCRSCSEVVGGICENCERCADCCNCYTCEECGGRFTEVCEDCERCEDHCNCGSEGPRFNNDAPCVVWHTAGKTEYKSNPLHRHLSVELEFIRTTDPAGTIQWARKHDAVLDSDGSLPDSGFELITNPHSGDLFARQITSLDSVLSFCEVDERCGYHVHVDTRDHATEDLRKLALLYAACEEGLFGLVKSYRTGHMYSNTCGIQFVGAMEAGKDWKQGLHRLLYRSRVKKQIEHAKKDKHGGIRYNALNLHSHFFRRSVEFRHHHGTKGPVTIYNWALICGWLVENAYRMSEKQIYTRIQGASSSLDLLHSLVPPTVSNWMSEHSFHPDTYGRVMTLSQVAHSQVWQTTAAHSEVL